MPRLKTTVAGAAGAAAGAAAPALYGRAIAWLTRRNIATLCAGDPEPLVRMFAAGAVLIFPGEHSWGRTYRGRDEIRGFLERFVAVGLRGEAGAILVQGPPWRTEIAVEFNDEARDPGGALVYENRALIRLTARWGRIVREETYEDTQRVVAFDEHLAARGALALR